MRLFHLIFLIFLSASVISAQNTDKYKFKKVSKELLKQSSHPNFPSAPAAYDKKRCKINFELDNAGNFRTVTTITERIKIYSKDGLKHKNFQFYLKRETNLRREEITKIEAYTFNLKNDEIEKTKLSRDDIFERQLNEETYLYKVKMPKVKEGSVVEIRYTLKSPFYQSIDPFYFQNEIPVNNVDYQISYPQYLTYLPVVKGPYEFDKTISEGKGVFKRNGSLSNIEFKSYIWSFEASAIPPLQNIPYIHNIDNFRSSIGLELESTIFPGEFLKKLAKSWNDIAIQLNENEKFEGYISSKNRDLEAILNKIKDVPEKEKIEMLYQHVSSSFEWNGETNLYGSSIRKLLNKKEGSSGDINLLLINLLKKADIDVLPIVLKTRNRGFINTSFPKLEELNYVIAGIRTPDGYLFLDATETTLPLGCLPQRALNLHGIAIDDEKGELLKITSPNKNSVTRYSSVLLSDDATLSGSVSSKFYNYANYKERLEIKTQDSYFSLIKSNNPNIIYSNELIEEVDNQNKPLVVQMDADFTSLINKKTDTLFIPVLLNSETSKLQFNEDERFYDLIFDSQLSSKTIVNLTIPSTFEIVSLPESISISLPDKSFIYRFNISLVGNTLNIGSFVDRKSDIISLENYVELQQIYEQIIEKNTQQIVLVRK